MQFPKLLAGALVCACSAFAAAPHSALDSHFQHKKPFHMMKGQTPYKSPNAARLVAARKELADEAKGLVTEQALANVSTGWTAKHKLYVGCTSTPVGSTYSQIQDAIDAAQLYTVIKVCPGTYDTGVLVNKSFIEIEGTSATEGAEILLCGGTGYGIELLASHDVIKNMSIGGCEYGVAAGEDTETTKNQIVNNWLADNFTSIYLYIGGQATVEGNSILASEYGIVDYGGIKNKIIGNTVEGSGGADGIAMAYTVGDQVKNNCVSDTEIGIDIGGYALTTTLVAKTTTSVGDYGFNTGADVISNYTYDNLGGIYLWNNNSGNRIQSNTVEDALVGIGADNTSGADASPDAGTNRFEKNKASGNDSDYEDETAPYSGNDTQANAGTADFWKGNKGTTATPPAILAQ